MLKKTFFLIFTFTFASVFAQNTNTTVVKQKTVAANVAANAVASPTPKKKTKSKPKLTTNADKDIVVIEKEEEPPANSTIRGRVYYEDTGRPVKRASVMLMSKDMQGGREYSGLTDNNGNVQIKNIKAGSYYAIVNAAGVVSPLAYADITKARDEESFNAAFNRFESIVVNGINDVEVQIPAKKGAAVSGRIIYADGDAAIGVNVQILRKVDSRFIPVVPNFSILAMAIMNSSGTFQTDDRGVYRFAGLPEGDYIVKVTENASHSENKEKGYYDTIGQSLFGGASSLLTMFYPDVFETEKAQIINLQLGQEASEINVIIPNRELYKIEGKVVASKDKLPIKSTKISLKRVGDKTFSFIEAERLMQTGTTDNEGKFTFKEIPQGTYKVTLEATNSNFDIKNQIYGSDGSDGNDSIYAANAPRANTNSYTQIPEKQTPKFAKKTQEITVDDKDLDNVVFELGFGATISGTILTEDNQELPKNIIISALNDDFEVLASGNVWTRDYSSGKETGKSRSDFKLEGIGEGKVSVSFETSEDEFYVKSITAKGVDLLVGQIEVKDGEFVRNVQVVFSKDVGTLKGKVLNTENEPAKNQKIVFVPTNSAKRKNPNSYKYTTTDANGEFEVKLPPFEFAVILDAENQNISNQKEMFKWIDEQVKDAQKFTIEINRVNTISIKLKK